MQESLLKRCRRTFWSFTQSLRLRLLFLLSVIKNCGRLKALAVGNYRLSFGQGLVISTDYLMGKQSTPLLSTAVVAG